MGESDAIHISKLTKIYKRKSFLCKSSSNLKDHVVLDDVSFDVKKGEVIGIIGGNGSGKSTLLKIIAKIIEPTSGSLDVNGKVASVLELGMGFHPDMSGRENIYLRGQLYGFSKKQLDSMVDEIIRYSGLEECIDEPVRTYSSGMSGRLAFSIMVHVDADILLIDEVLSTGDLSFSSKAYQHFKQLAARGKTVLFVSHMISAVEKLCSRAIWIENGKILADGSAKTICAKYNNSIFESFELNYNLAIDGVSDAQYRLALMYRDGRNVEQNYEEYVHWLELSSNGGYAPAQLMYAEVLDSTANTEKALELYEILANKGDATAKVRLSEHNSSNFYNTRSMLLQIYEAMSKDGPPSYAYRQGMLLLSASCNPVDLKTAYCCIEKAANAGYPEAMYKLGIMCRDGVGTTQSPENAIRWFMLASDAGLAKASHILGTMYREGKIVARDDSLSHKYYLLSAESGNPDAMYVVATNYRDGLGVDIDMSEANRWFEIMSNNQLIFYFEQAADYLKNNMVDCPISYENLCRMSADAKSNSAYVKLYNYYKDGQMVPVNNEDAIYWATKASGYFGTDRMILANELYSSGVCSDKVVEMYKSCSTYGDPIASYRLGLMYLYGCGVEKNLELAHRYFTMSAIRGNKGALLKLKQM